MPTISFYSTIKPFDHPIPSGDRLISGNLIQALQLAGYEVIIPTKFISYMKKPEKLPARKNAAQEELERILPELKMKKPNLQITYHPYCKAPDWIGAGISKALSIPYITIEACRTGKPGFELHREEAQEGIRKADLNLFFKDQDRDYLRSIPISEGRISRIKPFINETNMKPSPPKVNPFQESSSPLLVTTAMFREGKKTENYKILARVLEKIVHLPWNLAIIGDGPSKNEIHSFFSKIPKDRLFWAGQLPSNEVLGWMELAYAFLWPGLKEPIGMVYLEAGFMGAPSVGFRSMGVPLVVTDQITGLLANEGSEDDYARKVESILMDVALYTKIKSSTRPHILAHHTIGQAAATLKYEITRLLNNASV